MPNYNPKFDHLEPHNKKWKNNPTKAIRVPSIFESEILKYARALDEEQPTASTPGFELVIDILGNLSQDELTQLKLAINSLIVEETAPAIPAKNNITQFRTLTEDEKYQYKQKFGFVPSKYQIAIIDWILNSSENGCCNAVAGAGKSTSLWLVAKTLQESGLRIWQIRICVFGKKNALDLINKFGKEWKSSISTLHSAGWSLVRQELNIDKGQDVDITDTKYKRIAEELGLLAWRRKDSPSLLIREKIVERADIFYDLIDLVRLTNVEPTGEALRKICKHHNLEGLIKADDAAYWIKHCLDIGEEKARRKEAFDFTDQLYLPVKWELHHREWFKPYKFVLLDEGQDQNPLQTELVMLLSGQLEGIFNKLEPGRLLVVADPYQAIYGFAGADCNSYQNIVKRINAVELSLSICYRCPKKHIELVKKIFPFIPIEPSPDAIEGVIKQIEKKDLYSELQNGDMVLSRKTAPLVSLCLNLLSRGIKATVEGRKIGDSIKNEIDLIAKQPRFIFKEFNIFVDNYYHLKITTYNGLDNEEELKQNLKDKLEAIKAIYQANPQAKSITDLKLQIDIIFSDEISPITLCVVHRAKGLEAYRIFIYKPNDMPMKWAKQHDWQLEQEYNLLYVAMTRSKSELFIIGQCDWYEAPSLEKQPKNKTQAPKQDKSSTNINEAPQVTRDYETVHAEAKKEMDKLLSEVFKNKRKRTSFIKQIADKELAPNELEAAGKIIYTSQEAKDAVYSAYSRYWEIMKEFYEEEENRSKYGMSRFLNSLHELDELQYFGDGDDF